MRCLQGQRAALTWPFVMAAPAIEPVIAPCEGPWCPYRATEDPGNHGETSGTLDVHGYQFEGHDEVATERLGAIFLQMLSDSSRTLDRKDPRWLTR